MSDHFDADEFTCHPADEEKQMTAPLPPLPECIVNGLPERSQNVVAQEDVIAYAKFAVRWALERVEKRLIEADDGAYWYAKELARIPSAMIEEYK